MQRDFTNGVRDVIMYGYEGAVVVREGRGGDSCRRGLSPLIMMGLKTSYIEDSIGK